MAGASSEHRSHPFAGHQAFPARRESPIADRGGEGKPARLGDRGSRPSHVGFPASAADDRGIPQRPKGKSQDRCGRFIPPPDEASSAAHPRCDWIHRGGLACSPGRSHGRRSLCRRVGGRSPRRCARPRDLGGGGQENLTHHTEPGRPRCSSRARAGRLYRRIRSRRRVTPRRDAGDRLTTLGTRAEVGLYRGSRSDTTIVYRYHLRPLS
jgi:hypothetical protein